MDLPEIVDLARKFSVMVRIQGPDPKGLKMRKHAFHHYHSGKTTLSASGMLLPDTLYDPKAAMSVLGYDDRGLVLVVTVASVVEPFLSLKNRENLSQCRPELITGAHIDIMVEDTTRVDKDNTDLDKGASCWLATRLLTLVDVPASTLAFQSIIEASSGSSEDFWEVGWSLASDDSPQHLMDNIQKQSEHGSRPFTEGQSHLRELSNSSIIGKSTTRLALLGVSLLSKDLPSISISPSNKRGDFLLAMGSPFGVLSPVHFFNSISMGSIANCYPPSSSNRSLLMADIRCLPGTEGGPVFGQDAHLIGILIRPLRQKTSGAEIQLVIPWEAIATACRDMLHKEPQNADNRFDYSKGNINALGKAFTYNGCTSDRAVSFIPEHPSACFPSTLPVEKAMASICLVTIDDGVWASGVLLNNQGLILTNAHLLEPWRFGKSASGGRKTESEVLFSLYEESAYPGHSGVDRRKKRPSLLSKTLKMEDSSFADDHKGYKLNSSYRHRNIRVRMDHTGPWIWCDAKVLYVCKGPLDIALLQLECVPEQLSPIVMDFSCPSLGSKAYVIGHGLFGPKCDFSPSVCSGVVAKVVIAKVSNSYHSILPGDSQGLFPAMLETTAAVHPGGSGGAVVNSDGHMIGLVTSNARHGGGTIIPHLNFSLPCAALVPIFKFSRDMQDRSLLHELDQPNEYLSSVWALMPPLPPNPGGPSMSSLPESLLEDGTKEGKGSRFAKFIAERQDVFKRPTHHGKLERLSSAIIPSKL